MKTVALIGTFDTKGEEFFFVKELLQSLDLRVITIHTGVLPATFAPDINNEEVVKSGNGNLAELLKEKSKTQAIQALTKGVEKLLPRLFAEGRFDGVLAMGGSGGTAIACPGMRRIPIGVPKIMVSTVAAGDISRYVGASDIIMYPSVVDVSGLNRISMKVYINAALAIAGMLNFNADVTRNDRPLIGATMFGVTTPCVDMARKQMEKKGYEVIVFHATGNGGRAMEALVESGYFAGLLDLTTTEWCDEIAGGIMAGGPERMNAAAKRGLPQVVSVGALDMVNFAGPDTIPSKYNNRKFYQHNASITLMRTTIEENRKLGVIIAEKLNQSVGPVALMLPLGGVSSMDAEGQAFYGPEEDFALFEAIRNHLDRSKVELIEMETNINDAVFAEMACKKLIEYIEKSR